MKTLTSDLTQKPQFVVPIGRITKSITCCPLTAILGRRRHDKILLINAYMDEIQIQKRNLGQFTDLCPIVKCTGKSLYKRILVALKTATAENHNITFVVSHLQYKELSWIIKHRQKNFPEVRVQIRVVKESTVWHEKFFNVIEFTLVRMKGFKEYHFKYR